MSLASIVSPVRLRAAQSTEDMAIVRTLFGEYQACLGVSLCFQGFEQELATLPGRYAPPRGLLLLGERDGAAVACAALRPLTSDAGIGEMKRLYVRPDVRGTGTGRALALRILEHARAQRYRELVLDTLVGMDAARSLYASLGFESCAPYYDNPLPGVTYMRRAL